MDRLFLLTNLAKTGQRYLITLILERPGQNYFSLRTTLTIEYLHEKFGAFRHKQLEEES